MNLQTHEVASLIEGCKENKRASQNKLFEKFGGYVMGVAQRYTNNEHEAKDIFLKSFERVFKNVEKFDPEKGNLKTWLKVITIRVALNQIKSNKRFEFTDLEEIVEPESKDFFSEDIDMQYVATIVNNLKEPYGLIFNMVMDGYKHKEIGENLKISAATSRSYYKRSRTMIKEKLSNLKIDLIHG